VSRDMRLVQCGRVDHRIGPPHALLYKAAIDNGSHVMSKRTRFDVEPDRLMFRTLQNPNKRFAQMTSAARDQYPHAERFYLTANPLNPRNLWLILPPLR